MSLKGRTIRSWYFAALISVAVLPRFALSQSVVPPNDTVLHAFQGGVNDGFQPSGGVVFDSIGNLYGATIDGGNGGKNCFGGSCGTVYELSPSGAPDGTWNETILYNFTGVLNNYDGQSPTSALVIDNSGNLYGLTAYGGTGNCMIGSGGGPIGCGTVYEMSPPAQPGGAWVKTTIYSFQGGNDGFVPFGNLTVDAAGNMYGTTQFGGGFGSCNPFYLYCGTVFELSPPSEQGGAWTEKVLYSFKNGADGASPYGGLVFDKHGVIYGTTNSGGAAYETATPAESCKGAFGTGCGTVYKLQPPSTGRGQWVETVLHRFQNVPDGSLPAAGLAIDGKGNLFGTTLDGGATEGGIVFELMPPEKTSEPWKEKVIFNFTGLTGDQPNGPVMFDGTGNLFGTVSADTPFSDGAVFKLVPNSNDSATWSFTTLCNFPDRGLAAAPEYSLTLDGKGELYGVVEGYDHSYNGAVYKLNLPPGSN